MASKLSVKKNEELSAPTLEMTASSSSDKSPKSEAIKKKKEVRFLETPASNPQQSAIVETSSSFQQWCRLRRQQYKARQQEAMELEERQSQPVQTQYYWNWHTPSNNNN